MSTVIQYRDIVDLKFLWKGDMLKLKTTAFLKVNVILLFTALFAVNFIAACGGGGGSDGGTSDESGAGSGSRKLARARLDLSKNERAQIEFED